MNDDSVAKLGQIRVAVAARTKEPRVPESPADVESAKTIADVVLVIAEVVIIASVSDDPAPASIVEAPAVQSTPPLRDAAVAPAKRPRRRARDR